MSDFDNRVAEIQNVLLDLLGVISSADDRLEKFGSRFSALVAEAKDASQLVDAINRIQISLGKLKPENVQQMQQDMRALRDVLKGLDSGSLTSLTDALERQASVLERLSSTNQSIANSFQKTRVEVSTLANELKDVGNELDSIKQKLTNFSAPNINENDTGFNKFINDFTSFSKSLSNASSTDFKQLAKDINTLKQAVNSFKIEIDSKNFKSIDDLVTHLKPLEQMLVRLQAAGNLNITGINPANPEQKTPAGTDVSREQQVAQEIRRDIEEQAPEAKVQESIPKPKRTRKPKAAAVSPADQIQIEQENIDRAAAVDSEVYQRVKTMLIERRRIANKIVDDYIKASQKTGQVLSNDRIAQLRSIGSLLAKDPNAASDIRNVSLPDFRTLNYNFKQNLGIEYNNDRFRDAINLGLGRNINPGDDENSPAAMRAPLSTRLSDKVRDEFASINPANSFSKLLDMGKSIFNTISANSLSSINQFGNTINSGFQRVIDAFTKRVSDGFRLLFDQINKNIRPTAFDSIGMGGVYESKRSTNGVEVAKDLHTVGSFTQNQNLGAFFDKLVAFIGEQSGDENSSNTAYINEEGLSSKIANAIKTALGPVKDPSSTFVDKAKGLFNNVTKFAKFLSSDETPNISAESPEAARSYRRSGQAPTQGYTPNRVEETKRRLEQTLKQSDTGDSLVNKIAQRVAKFVGATNQLGAIVNALEIFDESIRQLNPGTFVDIGYALTNIWRAVLNMDRILGTNKFKDFDKGAFARRADTMLSFGEAGVSFLNNNVMPFLPKGVQTKVNNLTRAGYEVLQEQYSNNKDFLNEKQQEQALRILNALDRNIAGYETGSKTAKQSNINKDFAGDLSTGDPLADYQRREALKTMSPEDIKRMKIIETGIMNFSEGTSFQKGLASGYAVLSSSGMVSTMEGMGVAPEIAKQAGGYSGASLPYTDRNTGRKTAFGFTNRDDRTALTYMDDTDIIIHELTHGLTFSAGDKALKNTDLEKSIAKRRAYLTTPGNQQQAMRVASNILDQNQMQDLGGALKDQDYYFKSGEVLSNVSQALISGKAEFINFFRRLYGNELFDIATKTLKEISPDTYSKEGIVLLRERVEELNKSIGIAINASGEELDRAASQVQGYAFYDPSFNSDKTSTQMPGVTSTPVSNEAPSALKSTTKQSWVQRVKTSFTSFKNQFTSNIPEYISSILGSDIGSALSAAYEEMRIPDPNVSTNNSSMKQKAIRASEAAMQAILSNQIKTMISDPENPLSLGNVVAGILPDRIGPSFEYFSKPRSGMFGGLKDRFINMAAYSAGRAVSPNKQLDLYDEVNFKLMQKSGEGLDRESFNTEYVYDFNEGINRVSISAKTTSGAMVQLNGKIDEFNNLVLDTPKENPLSKFLEQVAIEIPRQITDEFVENLIFKLQELVGQIVDMQDELAEIGTLLESSSGTIDISTTKRAGSDFLYNSIDTAVETGQGFTEGVQTNIQNFKVLAPIQDMRERQEISNALSRTQLGSQTVFGISLEESLESIPAIFAQLRDSIDESITDPSARAAAAVSELNNLMSKLVVAQRESGAAGSDLIQVYAQLAASAGDAGLSQDRLLAITAASAVKLNKSPVETSNSIKALMERTYGEGRDDLEKLGIAVRQVNEDGTIGFRSWYDILKDSYTLMNDMPYKSKEITQAFGGRARANEAKKLIESIPEVDRIQQTLQPTSEGGKMTGEEFDVVLKRKSEVFAGALNKLQGSFALFLQEILFGSGLMDDIGNALTRVADSMREIADAAKGNPQVIQTIKQALQAVIIGFLGVFTAGMNAFSGIAKVINMAATTVRSFTSQLTLGLRAILQPATGAGRALAQIFTSMEASGSKSLSVLGSAAKALSVDLMQVAEVGKIATANVQGLGAVNSFLKGVTDKPTAVGVSGFMNTRAGKILGQTGRTLGDLALPIGMDVAMGGFSGENMMNVGAGIAGGFAGAFVGGPLGAQVGYMIGKGVSEYFDVYGTFLGTSGREQEKFASAYAEAKSTGGIENVYEQADALKEILSQSPISGPSTAVSSENLKNYERLIANAGDPSSIQDNFFLANYRVGALGNVENFYNKLEGSPDLKSLYQNSGISDPKEFLNLLTQAKDENTEITAKIKEQEQVQQAIRDLQQSQNSETSKGRDIFGGINETLDSIRTKMSDMRELSQYTYKVPTGLTEFGTFGRQTQRLNTVFSSKFNDISSGRITGQAAEDVMSQYQTARSSLEALPNTLAIADPLARKLGQDTSGMNKMLYQIGSEGQNEFQQQLSQLVEMQNFMEEYSALQEQATAIAKTPEYIDTSSEEHTKATQSYDAVQKQLQARQMLAVEYRAYLAMVKQEPDTLMKSLGLIKSQKDARKTTVIAGTPAQFQAPNIFDVSDYKTEDLSAALDYARQKQSDLTSMFPAWGNEFSKQQFLMSSGDSYKSVAGINQGFVNEYLQQQQQKRQQLKAPETVDLSEYTPEQTQKIIQRAQQLQSQAVNLAPDLAEKYSDERLLIMRKNNDLLMQTGLSQEYLRMAIDENTESNDQLRGHYNLPGNYRAPTVWDYYNAGGKETGSVNYVSPEMGKEGMVTMDFAKQLAEAILQGQQGSTKEAPNLAALGNTIMPGAAPMGYPTPGTPGRVITEPDLPFIDEALENLRPSMPAPPRNIEEEYDLYSYRDVNTSKRIDAKSIAMREQAAQRSGGGGGGGGRGWLEDLSNSSKPVKNSLQDLGQRANQSNNELGMLAKVSATAAVRMSTFAKENLDVKSISSFSTALGTAAAALGKFDLAALLAATPIALQIIVNGQANQGGSAAKAMINGKPGNIVSPGASVGKAQSTGGQGLKAGRSLRDRQV